MYAFSFKSQVKQHEVSFLTNPFTEHVLNFSHMCHNLYSFTTFIALLGKADFNKF